MPILLPSILSPKNAPWQLGVIALEYQTETWEYKRFLLFVITWQLHVQLTPPTLHSVLMKCALPPYNCHSWLAIPSPTSKARYCPMHLNLNPVARVYTVMIQWSVRESKQVNCNRWMQVSEWMPQSMNGKEEKESFMCLTNLKSRNSLYLTNHTIKNSLCLTHLNLFKINTPSACAEHILRSKVAWSTHPDQHTTHPDQHILINEQL